MIYRADMFNVSLKQTKEQEQEAPGKRGTSLIERGDALLIDGAATTIDKFMQEIGPREAERMVVEYAARVGIEKPEIDSWSFWGFEPTELTEVPDERHTRTAHQCV